jgi:hypothetical protein
VKMEKVFGIIPATSGPYIFIWIFSIIMGIVIIGLIGLFASFGYQAKHATFALTDQGLRISPGLYTRTIPKDKINIEGARVIDLKLEKDYQPKWRTNGAGLPGFSLGWFKLQNKEKALLFVTDRSSVVYIPTTDNYSVMLSVREADVMVQAMQQWEK